MTDDVNHPYLAAIDADRRVLGDLVDDLREAVSGLETDVDVRGFGTVEMFATSLRVRPGPSPAIIIAGSTDDVDAQLDEVSELSPSSLIIVLGERTDRISELMDLGSVHDVVGRPWRPAEITLRPLVIDAFEQWSSLQVAPGAEPVVLIGEPGDPSTYAIRDLFTRNPVPYVYFDRGDAEAQIRLDRLDASDLDTPIVITPAGRALSRPTNPELWTGLGEDPWPNKTHYELIIIGAGPAGMAVAINAASEGVDTVFLEFEAPGGQAGSSSRIENYVGFPSGLSGTEIARRAFNQAQRLGAEAAGVTAVDRLERAPDGGFIVASGDEYEITGRAIVVAVGLSWTKLPVEGAERFEGAGIFYGAARSEARSMSGRQIVIVGGANSAGQAAMFFADVACDVTVVVRGDSLVRFQ